MADGISKGVGEQLGSLGKQIVWEVTNLPAKLSGMDAPDEKKGEGQGTSAQGQKKTKGQTKSHGQGFNPIELLKQQDEIKKQKELAFTRQVIREFMRPQGQQSVQQKEQLEELEKRKQEIAEEKQKMQKVLQQPSAKPKRGNLFGIKAKRFAGEQGKNVKAQ